MQRTLLGALTTAVAAAGIAAVATIFLSDGDGSVETSPPVASPIPASTDPPAPGATRSTASVDCSKEPSFCAGTDSMDVEDGTVVSMSSADAKGDYAGTPRFRMTSTPLRPDEKKAKKGDEVTALHVEVVVRNDTSRTFVFPKREIALDVHRNGRLDERLLTKGDGFEMPPGGEMRGKFDKPITRDGSYNWQARAWFYAK